MKKILLTIFTIILILSVNILAVDIDIGQPAIDRAADIGGQRTYVNMTLKSAGSGIVTTVEIWTNSAMTDAEVATFYEGVANQLTTRDTEYIGAVSAGSKQTFTVSLDVEVDDCIGIYWSDAGVGIEQSTSGFDGVWFKDGDQIPCSTTTFSVMAGDAISLRGISAVGWTHKWNTQTISKWNTKEFTKWNGLE